MTKWEYMTVTFLYETDGTGDAQIWSRTFEIRRPDADGVTKLDADKTDWTDLLNELGAQGWELIVERQTHSVVFGGQTIGWFDAAGPIRTVFTFKRSSASQV